MSTRSHETTIVTCDRCGYKVAVEYIDGALDNPLSDLMWVKTLQRNSYGAWNLYDLCPACTASFQKWLAQKDAP